MHVNIYVPYPVESSYTYRAPDNLDVAPGTRVTVNFAGRVTTGYVVDAGADPVGTYEIKDVIDVIDDEPVFDERLVELARITSETYLSSMGEVLAMALPSGKRQTHRYRLPFEPCPQNKDIVLNKEQERVYRDIIENLNEPRGHLIYGITGSGKTEIYIELAREVIRRGKSVIYLVPEISLSSQIFERLHAVFGEELIIYHSHLTGNQRLYNWKQFYSGKASIAIGTRSAVFLQCPSPGLIIIDEEHDGSYKEHSTPRYNARRIAMIRSRNEGACVVLGSATPSLESLYAADKGVLTLHRLASRYGGASMPEVRIVKVSTGSQSDMISSPLKLLTKKAVERGEQAIYLLNRRGFAPLVICNSCGAPVECPHCNISMCYHQGDVLICHYCGYKRRVPERCEQCHGCDLVKIGSGTQKVEESIRKVFPSMNVLRLDQDTARKKGFLHECIDKMKKGEIDILLGTQMVAKGFDFHRVTVVGVLMADIGMHLPDFRASERIFSLLMQVAGRSGRGSEKGRVLIQTINDSHELFKFIITQDHYGFYRSEIETRRIMAYPPFTRIARLLMRGRKEERVIEAVHVLYGELQKAIHGHEEKITVLGPSSAPLAKIGGNYRYHIILKAGNAACIRSVITKARRDIHFRDVYLEIDIDPYDML